MAHPLTRRALLGTAAGGVLAPAVARAQTPRAEERFAFPLLGDLHFDRLSHHDMEWMEKNQPADVPQVKNYSELTATSLARLFPEIRETIAGSRDRVPFTAHIGDLVEGVCGRPDLARKHCEECVEFVEAAKLGAPLVMCKGNHDVTGPGAVEAFNQVLLPYLAREAKQELRSANYAWEEGGCLFVSYDAYSRDSLDWLEKALEGRRARHFFFLIHMPVVPYAARAHWHVFAKPEQQVQRERLLTLLGRHHAIVLCGHLHKYGIVSRKTKEGRFVQLSVSSVIPKPDAQPKQVLAGLDRYGPDLVQLEPSFDAKSVELRRELLIQERPFIEHFEYADAPGYAFLTVDGKQVTARLYTGLGKQLWKSVELSGLV